MSLSIQLRQFADSLAPGDDITRQANNAIERIHNVIHKNLGEHFSIDRIRPLGSLTKKTSLWFKMDIDIVVYLNDEMPPFSDFIDKLDDVIIMNIDEDCEKTPHGLKLKVDDFDVDLLPATNFLYQNGFRGGNEARTQNENALSYLKQARARIADKMDFSASLSEAAVDFERSRGAFSHALSRLAKFWSMTIGIHDFSYGRSSIMEYLGAKAAEDEEGSQNTLKGFQRFLRMIEHVSSINVFWDEFYSKDDIPPYIEEQRPLLLDPTNPYNNLLRGRNVDFLKQMSSFASVTLSRINKAKDSNMALLMIFEPQPKIDQVYSYFFTNPSKSPQNFLVGSYKDSIIHPKKETGRGATGRCESRHCSKLLLRFC
ncbi:2'-5'-oligoadenylate synthase-like protein 2 [Holothuria leucospilota]|uniref:2'-5'-oligoadenylate synthase-like protein 2 n=1 Tax=Holothuria leucospilota TaxID=206669 RepID=A0A9Q1BK76_HOLLE|nr:2'-5'-oligoadenylate synthase-like protein 2 [Holothuria leucospilota]